MPLNNVSTVGGQDHDALPIEGLRIAKVEHRKLSPAAWIKNMLRSRGLDAPDGRALFRYRLNDDEFDELAQVIRFTSQFGIEHLTTMLSWDGIFVIYASEWWRREFCGQWGWEEVFKSVGIDFTQLPVSSRNSLIEDGLRRWHREVRVRNGARRFFLGTIATEGGLPLHKLSESGGWLKSILQPVLRRHIARGYSISALIEAHSNFIPVSLKSPEIEEILEDLVQAIVDLRTAHRLSEKPAPIKWLDEHSPSWRDDFPLPVDDEAARSLLGDLVDTASRAKVDESSSDPFEVQRFLINAETDQPEIMAEMELPNFVSLESIDLNAERQALPSTMQLEVFQTDDVTRSWPWCRAVLTTFREERALKLSGRNFTLKGSDSIQGLKVRIKSMGETIAEVEILGAAPLDTDIPWLFKKVDTRWQLHGTSSQSVKNDEALIYRPVTYSLEPPEEDGEILPLANFLKGQLWNLRGEVICASGTDRFRFRTSGKETNVAYKLQGKQFPYFSNPGVVFVGKPAVLEIDGLTGRQNSRFDARLLARLVGSSESPWGSIDSVETGIYQIRVVDSDANVLFSQTVGLLDVDYSHVLAPSANDPCSGSITIKGLDWAAIACTAENSSIVENFEGGLARFELQAAVQPPRFALVSLLAKGQGRELQLNYPFPTRGALIFDPSDKLVPTGTALYLNNLHGHRIKIFNDKPHLSNGFELTLSLRDQLLSRGDLQDIYISRPMKLNGDYLEISISDWSAAIQSLFGVGKSLDAVVRVSLTLQGNSLLQFDVRQYEHLLHPDRAEGVLEIESTELSELSSAALQRAEIYALRLDSPDKRRITLEALTSEGVAVGRWAFEPWKRAPGPWLIYPGEFSMLGFRPVLRNVGDSIDDGDVAEMAVSLRQAVGVADTELREERFRVVLVSMAQNLSHESWHYLDALWEATSHLPMICFDVWQVASREPKFLAALLVKNNAEVIEKLEIEFPIIWELVSQADWESALDAYRRKYQEELKEDEKFVDELIDKAITRIETHTTSLQSMGKILQGTVRGKHTPEMGLMKQPAENYVKPRLTEEYQKLFRRQADSKWPVFLERELIAAHNKLPEKFRTIVSAHHQYQHAVVQLPVVLAWDAICKTDNEWSATPSEIFKLNQLIKFDEDWFDVAFQFLSGWLSQQDHVQRENR